MASTAQRCPMCNDKKGLGAPPKPDKIKKVNLLSGENPAQDVLDKYKCCLGCVPKMLILRFLLFHDECERQILGLHHRSTGEEILENDLSRFL